LTDGRTVEGLGGGGESDASTEKMADGVSRLWNLNAVSLEGLKEKRNVPVAEENPTGGLG